MIRIKIKFQDYWSSSGSAHVFTFLQLSVSGWWCFVDHTDDHGFSLSDMRDRCVHCRGLNDVCGWRPKPQQEAEEVLVCCTSSPRLWTEECLARVQNQHCSGTCCRQTATTLFHWRFINGAVPRGGGAVTEDWEHVRHCSPQRHQEVSSQSHNSVKKTLWIPTWEIPAGVQQSSEMLGVVLLGAGRVSEAVRSQEASDWRYLCYE